MLSNKFILIDYKMGNLKSVYNAFKFLGYDVEISDDIQKLKDSSAIILPGVGAFGDAMKNLESTGLKDVLIEEISKGKPYLGICLGFQMLFEESEEEPGVKGLGVFKGNVVRFKTNKCKVPHIGWNQIEQKKDSLVLKNIADKSFFYFVHSYYPVPEDKNIIMTTTEYDEEFTSSVCQENIYASQFHPEKSQDDGLQMIKNFGEYCVNNTGN